LGVVGAAAGLGGSMAGFPLAFVTKQYGWNGFVLILVGSSFLGSLLLIPLWSVKRLKED
jgi:sugar phosphate permease